MIRDPAQAQTVGGVLTVSDEGAATRMQEHWRSSCLYIGNAPYIEGQYELYLADATQVPQEWRDYFDALRVKPPAGVPAVKEVAQTRVPAGIVPPSTRTSAMSSSEDQILRFARRQVAVQSLIAAYRLVGTQKAALDPLQWLPAATVPELTPSFHGLVDDDLGTTFSAADTFFAGEHIVLADLLRALQDTYCGTLSAEYMHLRSPEQRRWWQMRLEPTRSKPGFAAQKKLRILDRLTVAESLERYLHLRFVGQQRFSLEGGESLIPLLDALLQAGAARDIKHVVMGMAHRGRLNVLLNIAGKPASAVFAEFERDTDEGLLAGDVKYHRGHSGVAATPNGPIEVLLAFNPSHLEFVNPVVQGIARAKADAHKLSSSAVLPIEVHGDAAVIGQGVVQETLNLSYTRAHGTGGTVHVVVNNQVGFTTSDPRDARSACYCTDVAKIIEAPVLHVNGDDPEAVVHAAELALAFRTEFERSVVVEMVCFRRHGHQEQDTPTITQPLMYRAVAAHPGVRALYAKQLEAEGLATQEDADKLVRSCRESLGAAYQESLRMSVGKARRLQPTPAVSPGTSEDPLQAPGVEELDELAERITRVPPEYKLHPLVRKVMDARGDMAAGTRPLDWGMAEHLAFATLLSAGVDVRLTGQDSERGTFGHRHAVLHNQNRQSRGEGKYLPLQNLGHRQGEFRVANTPLSEAAVLAYEYGYSVTRPGALVLWEAQFGDFANGAQVVIDQFISAGFAKWGQRSSVVMLLPHGQEGQGPEHASARLERYLQLCAQDNLRVCQPTTPAQVFHLLRAHPLLPGCCPLVVMTPKSLLRPPEAVSSLADLSSGGFAPVLGDPATQGAAEGWPVKRVIVCSGKVYYELLERRRRGGHMTVALVRVEQLYPFPAHELGWQLARYPNADALVWCQEEAQNQGAWNHLAPQLHAAGGQMRVRYAGPAAAASTAPGHPSVHAALQEALLKSAFED